MLLWGTLGRTLLEEKMLASNCVQVLVHGPFLQCMHEYYKHVQYTPKLSKPGRPDDDLDRLQAVEALAQNMVDGATWSQPNLLSVHVQNSELHAPFELRLQPVRSADSRGLSCRKAWEVPRPV